MAKLTIGLDFGTESVRAVLVDVRTGEVLAETQASYPDGVLDRALPNGVKLPPDWALQNPEDWLSGLESCIRRVLDQSKTAGESVIGIGLDFTACTVLPTHGDGTPLCRISEFRSLPHSWAKLWKHHAAQPQADRINELAARREEPWLQRYGGRISSEWLLPKALQIAEEAPEVFDSTDRIVEGGDWVVWQLTGNLVRNACAAGYKALWHKKEGYPSGAFLKHLDPRLEDLYEQKVAGPVLPPGRRAGRLRSEWAERLGLPPETAVATPIVDAHAAVAGGGVGRPGVLYMIMGTSTCHMLMADREETVPGISGVVEDGIVPGYFGYEAGQAAVGDIFAWFVHSGVPPELHEEAHDRGMSLHDLLSEKASALTPGGTGLLALDWWNGNRSTLVDAELSGLLVGVTLATRPEEIYRSLIESTAFGTRIVIEAFTGQELPVEEIVAGGGLTRNDLLMQIYADVTGREIAVAGGGQAAALGSAMLAAVAAGGDSGGHETLAEAIEAMAPPPAKRHQPIPENTTTYHRLFREYRRLYDYFGRGGNTVMKLLREISSATKLEDGDGG